MSSEQVRWLRSPTPSHPMRRAWSWGRREAVDYVEPPRDLLGRSAIRTLRGVVLPVTLAYALEPDETDRLLAALWPQLDRCSSTVWRESIELLKAVRLAPSLEVCEALLRGEKVPKSRLDPKWAKAYGLR